MINIFIGNHGYNVHTQDIFEYIHDGLRIVGESPCFFPDKLLSEGCNIALEYFRPNITEQIIAHQSQHPHSKFFIIVSESVSGNTFNSANISSPANSQAKNHYENSAYWEERYRCFSRLLNMTSGLIAISECLFDDYTKAFPGLPIFYLPMVDLPTIVPIKQLPFSQKDLDIYFSGTLTQYRLAIIERFKSLGLQVFATGSQLPEYLRQHFLGRSKLAIGLKLDESTRILSKARSHYFLTRQCPHLIEPVEEKTDLDPYLSFSPDPDIVAASIQMLHSGCKFNLEAIKKFKEDFSYQDVFLSLVAFLQNCSVMRQRK